MEFNYYFTTQAIGNLLIDDIGNCAIEANSDDGCFYYFVSKTTLGFTRIFQYGPLVKSSDVMHKSVRCTFKRIEYDQNKVAKEIKSFLNQPFVTITQAIEIDPKEALNNCISIIEYMKDDEAY